MRILQYAVVAFLLLAFCTAPAQGVEVPTREAPTFNGSVHAIAQRGSTVYVGGSFTTATWRGRTHQRLRLAAFDSRTGALLSWAPSADGTVRALATTADSVYAAGSFHSIGGVRRDSLARISAGSSAVGAFRHDIDGTPYALATGHGRLYLGGSFSTVDGAKRRNTAAFSLSTGRLDPRHRVDTDDRVHALAVRGANLYLGGVFETVNGVRGAPRLAAVNATTGMLDRYFQPRPPAAVNAIAVDGAGVAVATGGQGGRAIAYTLAGVQRWQRVFDGDAVAITIRNGATYVGGHFDRACSTVRTGSQGACLDGARPRVKLAAISATGQLTGWAPRANGVIGVRALATDGTTGAISAGGDFTLIEGKPRPRFVLLSGAAAS